MSDSLQNDLERRLSYLEEKVESILEGAVREKALVKQYVW